VTAQETNNQNFFSTTLTSGVSSSDTTFPVASIGSLTTPCYLIVDPESVTKREVILFDGVFGGASFVTSGVGKRGLAGSASGAQAHASGVAVESRPIQQHMEDINDRVDTLDHGASLAGLADDDHTQYHTDARGDARYLNLSVVTTKGDVVGATASSTLARLGVGANDTVLTADSAEATGLKWATVITTADRATFSGFVSETAGLSTNTQLPRPTGETNPQRTISLGMTRAGSIVGISASTDNARTSGTLTLEVFKNGVATGLTCVVNGTTPQWSSAVQAAALDTFVANDYIDIRGTNASFLPTSEVECFFEVQYS
jgi:hypothetical protein